MYIYVDFTIHWALIPLFLYSRPQSPSWERFHNRISQFEMYGEDDVVDDVLRDMATLPITQTVQKSGGTQLKLTFTFSDQGRAMWKPMR